MKIMIIGGTHFIGPAVARRLQHAGHEITLFHRTKSAGPHYPEIQGDCNSVNDLKKALNIIKPNIIVHMTAMYQSHIKALEDAIEQGKLRLILISSADVYQGFEIFNRLSTAAIAPIPFTESSPLREGRYPYRGKPEVEFGHDYDKILVEQAARQSPVLDAVILRLGMVYGENDPQRRFGEIIHQINQGANVIQIPAKLANFKTCKSYVENIAQGIALATEKGKPGEIYNLADSEIFTELEWDKMIAERMNWHGHFEITSASSKSAALNAFNLDQHLVLDTAKIRTELHYTEVVSVADRLMRTIHWELLH